MSSVSLLQAPEELFRLRVVKCYIDEGFAATMAAFRLTDETLREWLAAEWWPDMAKQVYNGQAEELDRRMTKLINKALVEAESRLEEGDTVLDRFGQEQKIPLKGKDAAVLAALFLDKRQVLRGLPSSILKTDIRLDIVAEKLRSIVRSDSTTIVVTSNKELNRAGEKLLR